MSKITTTAGLVLARDHMIAHAPAPYLRPGFSSTSNNSLMFQWDFPSGGTAHVTIGFDLAHVGAIPKPVLVPRARVAASIGAHAQDATMFAHAILPIIAAAQGAEALMRTHSYVVGDDAADEPAAARPLTVGNLPCSTRRSR
jgi:hypothetical protein